MKKICSRPKYSVSYNGNPILIAQHNTNTKNPHDNKMHIHIFAYKGLQKVETNKIEGELRLNHNPFNPTSHNRTKSLCRDQETKNNPKHNQGAIIDMFE